MNTWAAGLDPPCYQRHGSARDSAVRLHVKSWRTRDAFGEYRGPTESCGRIRKNVLMNSEVMELHRWMPQLFRKHFLMFVCFLFILDIFFFFNLNSVNEYSFKATSCSNGFTTQNLATWRDKMMQLLLNCFGLFNQDHAAQTSCISYNKGIFVKKMLFFSFTPMVTMSWQKQGEKCK